MKRIGGLAVAVMGWMALSCASAGAVITTVGFRSAVATPENTATFSGLSSGDVLDLHIEDDLFIDVSDTQFEPFGFFGPETEGVDAYFGAGGNTSFVSITHAFLTDFQALEFRHGTGFISCINSGGAGCSFFWETRRDGQVTGSGRVSNYENGAYYGWIDPAGFDELRVASFGKLTGVFGDLQAIALADVRATSTVAAVPLPASLALLLGAMGGLGLFARRRRVLTPV